MELKDAVLGRRSIRFYKTGKISQADIQAIIAAANMAPSWKNSQTPRYYVATSEEAMNKVREALPERNTENTKNAAALIVMTFERGRAGFMKIVPFLQVKLLQRLFHLGLQTLILRYQNVKKSKI